MRTIWCLLIAFSGCATRSGAAPDASSNPDGPQITALRISPSDATLTIKNRALQTLTYTVVAVDPAGVETDVTAQASLSVPSGFAEFASNTLSSVGNVLGKTQVTASFQGFDSITALTIKGEESRVEPGAPIDSEALFDSSTVDSARQLTVLYPPQDVVVPRSLGDLDVHWASATDDVFEVTLKNEISSLRVFVPVGTQGKTMKFLPTDWIRAIGVQPKIEISIRGLNSASPSTVSQSEPVRITASDTDMQGGIYYWSTGAGGGFWRHDMAKPGQAAESYLDATEAGQCVGCHVLTRDGKRMLVTYIDSNAALYDVASKTKLAQIPGTGNYDLFTYHPSGNVLISQSGNNLRVLDGTSGAELATEPLVENMIQPDFSPLGDKLVYVGGETSGSHHVVYGAGAIMSRSYDAANHTFGTPQEVLRNGQKIYYPVVSPDGQWIAYNTAATGNSVSNANGEIWVVKIDGTKATKLTSANIDLGMGNSWARWAPFAQTVNGESIFWLTFSSQRPYGVFGPTRPQIWMSAFSPSRAEAGLDPSMPAFRLPFQDLTVGNHIGQWTEAIVAVD
jgi:hypothetical protein